MYLQQYIGVLGWLDTRLPRWLVIAELIVIAVVCLQDTSRHLRLAQCLNAIGIATVVSATVMVIIYVTWEPVGSGVIHLQGRYFVPVGPLMVIAISGLKVAVSPFPSRTVASGRIITAALVPCLLAATFYSAYERYFVISLTPVSQHQVTQQMRDTNEVSELHGQVSGAVTTPNLVQSH